MSQCKSLKKGFFISLCVAGIGVMLQGCGGGGGGGGASGGGGGGGSPSPPSPTVTEAQVNTVASTAATAVDAIFKLKKEVTPFTESIAVTLTDPARAALTAVEEARTAAKAAQAKAQEAKSLFDADPTQASVLEAINDAISLTSTAQKAIEKAVIALINVATLALKETTLTTEANAVLDKYSEQATTAVDKTLTELFNTAKGKEEEAEEKKLDALRERNNTQNALTVAAAKTAKGKANRAYDEALDAANAAKGAANTAKHLKTFNSEKVKDIQDLADEALRHANKASEYVTAALNALNTKGLEVLEEYLAAALEGRRKALAAWEVVRDAPNDDTADSLESSAVDAETAAADADAAAKAADAKSLEEFETAGQVHATKGAASEARSFAQSARNAVTNRRQKETLDGYLKTAEDQRDKALEQKGIAEDERDLAQADDATAATARSATVEANTAAEKANTAAGKARDAAREATKIDFESQQAKDAWAAADFATEYANTAVEAVKAAQIATNAAVAAKNTNLLSLKKVAEEGKAAAEAALGEAETARDAANIATTYATKKPYVSEARAKATDARELAAPAVKAGLDTSVYTQNTPAEAEIIVAIVSLANAANTAANNANTVASDAERTLEAKKTSELNTHKTTALAERGKAERAKNDALGEQGKADAATLSSAAQKPAADAKTAASDANTAALAARVASDLAQAIDPESQQAIDADTAAGLAEGYAREAKTASGLAARALNFLLTKDAKDKATQLKRYLATALKQKGFAEAAQGRAEAAKEAAEALDATAATAREQAGKAAAEIPKAEAAASWAHKASDEAQKLAAVNAGEAADALTAANDADKAVEATKKASTAAHNALNTKGTAELSTHKATALTQKGLAEAAQGRAVAAKEAAEALDATAATAREQAGKAAAEIPIAEAAASLALTASHAAQKLKDIDAGEAADALTASAAAAAAVKATKEASTAANTALNTKGTAELNTHKATALAKRNLAEQEKQAAIDATDSVTAADAASRAKTAAAAAATAATAAGLLSDFDTTGKVADALGYASEAQGYADAAQTAVDNITREETLEGFLAEALRQKGLAEDELNNAENAQRLAEADDATAVTVRKQAGEARGFAGDATTAAEAARKASDDAIAIDKNSQNTKTQKTTAAADRAKEYADEAGEVATTVETAAAAAEKAVADAEAAKNLLLNGYLIAANKGKTDAETAEGEAKTARDAAKDATKTLAEAKTEAGNARDAATKAQNAATPALSASRLALAYLDQGNTNTQEQIDKIHEIAAAATAADTAAKNANTVASEAENAVETRALDTHKATALAEKENARLAKVAALAEQVKAEAATDSDTAQQPADDAIAALGRADTAALAARDASDLAQAIDSKSQQAIDADTAATAAEGFAGEAKTASGLATAALNFLLNKEAGTQAKLLKEYLATALEQKGFAEAAQGRAEAAQKLAEALDATAATARAEAKKAEAEILEAVKAAKAARAASNEAQKLKSVNAGEAADADTAANAADTAVTATQEASRLATAAIQKAVDREEAAIAAALAGFLKTAQEKVADARAKATEADTARKAAVAAVTAGDIPKAKTEAGNARTAATEADRLARLAEAAHKDAKLLKSKDGATLEDIRKLKKAARNAADTAAGYALTAETTANNAETAKLNSLLADVNTQLKAARDAKRAVDKAWTDAQGTSVHATAKAAQTDANAAFQAAKDAASAANTASGDAQTLNDQAPQAVEAKTKAQEVANVRDEIETTAGLVSGRVNDLAGQTDDEKALNEYLETALAEQKKAEDARDDATAARLETQAAQTTLDALKAQTAFAEIILAQAAAEDAKKAANTAYEGAKALDENAPQTTAALAAKDAAYAAWLKANAAYDTANKVYKKLQAGVKKADKTKVIISGWAAVARIQANKAIAAQLMAEAAQEAAAKDDVTAAQARLQAEIAEAAAEAAKTAATAARTAANTADRLNNENRNVNDSKVAAAQTAASEAATALIAANTAAAAANLSAVALEIPVRLAYNAQLDSDYRDAKNKNKLAENALDEIIDILYDIQNTQDTITATDIQTKAKNAKRKAGTIRGISNGINHYFQKAEAIIDNERRMPAPSIPDPRGATETRDPEVLHSQNVNTAEAIIDYVKFTKWLANRADILVNEIEAIATYAENAEKAFPAGFTKDKFTVFSYVKPKYKRKTGNDESFIYVWGQIYSNEDFPDISYNVYLWENLRKRGEHTVKVKTSKMIYLGWSKPYHPKPDSHWDKTTWSSLSKDEAQAVYDERYENAFQHIGYRYNVEIFDMIGVAHAYARGITGKGVVVGVLDSHFVEKLMKGMVVTDDSWNDVKLPSLDKDRDFHGTIVSRIIASGKTHYSGNTDEDLVASMVGIWPHGVAYNAKIFPLDTSRYHTRAVAIGNFGVTTLENVPIDDIRKDVNSDFALFHKHKNDIDIVNMSVADTKNQENSTLEQLIEYFTDEGILVVSALGNTKSTNRTPSTPAARAHLPKFNGRYIVVGSADIRDAFVWQKDPSLEVENYALQVERVHRTKSAASSRWCRTAKDFCLFAPVVVEPQRMVHIAEVERTRRIGPDPGTPSYYVTPRSSYGFFSNPGPGFVWHPHTDGRSVDPDGFKKSLDSAGEYYYTHAGGSPLGQLETNNPALGTSMATPMVAGAAALLMERWPSLAPEDIAQVLLQTADDIGAPGVDEVFGHGLLNIRQALSSVGVEKVAAIGSVSSSTASAVPITPKLSFIVPSSLGDALHNQPLSITVLDDFNRDFSYSLYGGFLGFAQVKSLQFFVPAGQQVATRHTLFGGRLNLHLQYWQTPGLDVPLPDELQQIMEQKSSEEAKRSLGLSFSWRASGTLYRFGLGTKAKGKPYIAGETVLGLYHSMPQETQITPNYSLSVQRSVKNVGNVTLGLTMANRQYVEHFDQSYSPGGYRLYVAYSHYPIQLETGYIQDFRSVAGITGRELLDVGHGKTLYLNLQTSLHFRSVTFLGSYYVSRAVSAEADSGWFKKLEVLSRSFGLEGQWRVSEEGDRVTFGFSRPLRSTLDMGVWDMGIDEEGHYLWDLKPRNTAPSGSERLFFLSYEKSGTIQSLKLLGGLRLERGHRKDVLPERFFSFSFSYRF